MKSFLNINQLAEISTDPYNAIKLDFITTAETLFFILSRNGIVLGAQKQRNNEMEN